MPAGMAHMHAGMQLSRRRRYDARAPLHCLWRRLVLGSIFGRVAASLNSKRIEIAGRTVRVSVPIFQILEPALAGGMVPNGGRPALASRACAVHLRWAGEERRRLAPEQGEARRGRQRRQRQDVGTATGQGCRRQCTSAAAAGPFCGPTHPHIAELALLVWRPHLQR